MATFTSPPSRRSSRSTRKLSPGGYCITDDYNLEYRRKPVADYRSQHGITAEIIDIDGLRCLLAGQCVITTPVRAPILKPRTTESRPQ